MKKARTRIIWGIVIVIIAVIVIARLFKRKGNGLFRSFFISCVAKEIMFSAVSIILVCKDPDSLFRKLTAHCY